MTTFAIDSRIAKRLIKFCEYSGKKPEKYIQEIITRSLEAEEFESINSDLNSYAIQIGCKSENDIMEMTADSKKK